MPPKNFPLSKGSYIHLTKYSVFKVCTPLWHAHWEKKKRGGGGRHANVIFNVVLSNRSSLQGKEKEKNN